MKHKNRTQKGVFNNKSNRRSLRSSMTYAEHQLWIHLKNKNFKGLKFRRQHGIGPYIVDFYCPNYKLVIEVDGDVHACDEQIQKDLIREKYLKSLNLKVVRVFNNDVYANIEGVLSYLDEQTSE